MLAFKGERGTGRNNKYFKINDEVTLLCLNGRVINILDTKYVEELKKLSITYRGTPNGTLPAYCDLKCEDGKHHYIALGKIVSDLANGKVSNLSKNMVYPYDGEECHHKYARIDNRSNSVLSLTKEEHKKLHMNVYGGSGKSHHTLNISIVVDENTGRIEIEDEKLMRYLNY